MNGYLVTDESGQILRWGRSRTPAKQIGTDGAAVYRLQGWNGSPIPDADVAVSDGALVPVGDYAGPIPDVTLVPVAP